MFYSVLDLIGVYIQARCWCTSQNEQVYLAYRMEADV